MTDVGILRDGVAPVDDLADELVIAAMARALRALPIEAIEAQYARAQAYLRAGLSLDDAGDRRLAALDARALRVARLDPLRGIRTGQRTAA